MREAYLERKFVNAVKLIGGKAVKFVSPGNRGVSDRLVILPRGRTVYVETKAPGEPLAPLQQKWAEDLRKMGHKVYKIDSLADIDRFIAEQKEGGI
jgi:hypothetical protein